MMVWAKISNYGLLVRLWLGRRLGLSDLASGSGMDGAWLWIGSMACRYGSGLAGGLARVGSRDDAYPSECVRICPAR